ncbi:hypothetical protein [Leuconostoc mesenteroides]|uniref:hypothetical protein n=1 Tax=Leuconostoc mesenteroides TaxID=1245 RepID=UPI0039965BD4
MLHYVIQMFNNIQCNSINFYYMNLSQLAHDECEYAFIHARIELNNSKYLWKLS